MGYAHVYMSVVLRDLIVLWDVWVCIHVHMSVIYGLNGRAHTYEWNMHMHVCISVVVCISVYMSVVCMHMSVDS